MKTPRKESHKEREVSQKSAERPPSSQLSSLQNSENLFLFFTTYDISCGGSTEEMHL